MTVTEDDYDYKGSPPEPRLHFLMFKKQNGRVWGGRAAFFENVQKTALLVREGKTF